MLLTRIFNYAIFDQFALLKLVYARSSQFVALTVCFLYVFHYKKISLSIIWGFIYTVVLFIATILGSGNYYSIIQRIYPLVSFLMFIEIQIKCGCARILMKAIAKV